MKWLDMHCDTLSEAMKSGQGLLKNSLCVDAERLCRSDSAASFYACFVNAGDADLNFNWDLAYRTVGDMIGYGKKNGIRIIENTGDPDAFNSGGRGRGILTVEEGGVLNGEIGRLDELYAEGVRLITLTWNYENCIGFPNSSDSRMMERGLTGFGIDVVHRMNELGMLIDVSHLSDGGFYDCIRYSSRPVTASHSNARTLCRHPRNLSDDMLRKLGENGGVAGLNFYSVFLTSGSKAKCADIAAHAEWMINRAGEDAVAIGTDLDGFERERLPDGIRDVLDIEKVWDAFLKKGITPRQIEKIASGNVLRILKEQK